MLPLWDDPRESELNWQKQEAVTICRGTGTTLICLHRTAKCGCVRTEPVSSLECLSMSLWVSFLSDGTSESLATWQVQEVVHSDFLLAEPSCASASRSTASQWKYTHIYTNAWGFVKWNSPVKKIYAACQSNCPFVPVCWITGSRKRSHYLPVSLYVFLTRNS